MDEPENGQLHLNDHQTQRSLFGEALFRANDLAYLYGLKPATIEDWMRTGRIGAIKLGRYWYVPESSLKSRVRSALENAGLRRPPPKRKPRPAGVQPINETPALFEANEA
jgi:hypothetical protein